MSRTKTFIIHCIDDSKEIPEHDDNTMSFISITDESVFTELYGKLGTRFSGIAVADNHALNVTRIMREAFRQRIHYFKVTKNSDAIAYCRRDKPFVLLSNYSWGVDMNEMKRRIRSKAKLKQSDVDDIDIYFDENYKTITGVLSDISFWMGIPVEIPTMEVEDLSVYIARWGGVPGKEKFNRPYSV